MLKTCSICGIVHDFNKICHSKRYKKTTDNSLFRSTSQWTAKSKEIRARDKFLCQVCLTKKYGTEYEFNHKSLEVHHIVPLSVDYDKRLDDTNLITLCRFHHEMADNGAINIEELKDLVSNSPLLKK